jgi:hypothetical protein
MAARYEATRATAWIYTTLVSDATLRDLLGGPRVYSRLVPSSAQSGSWIVFSRTGGRPLTAIGNRPVWNDLIFTVDLVTNTTDDSVIEPIIDRVLELLDGRSGNILDARVIECHRVADRQYDERKSNITYTHTQVDFRLLIRVPPS